MAKERLVSPLKKSDAIYSLMRVHIPLSFFLSLYIHSASDLGLTSLSKGEKERERERERERDRESF